jgi:rubredoxin-NAD+ reductase
MKYKCDICGWVYDEVDGAEEHDIAPNTKWNNIPDDFLCPLCGADKDQFSKK